MQHTTGSLAEFSSWSTLNDLSINLTAAMRKVFHVFALASRGSGASKTPTRSELGSDANLDDMERIASESPLTSSAIRRAWVVARNVAQKGTVFSDNLEFEAKFAVAELQAISVIATLFRELKSLSELIAPQVLGHSEASSALQRRIQHGYDQEGGFKIRLSTIRTFSIETPPQSRQAASVIEQGIYAVAFETRASLRTLELEILERTTTNLLLIQERYQRSEIFTEPTKKHLSHAERVKSHLRGSAEAGINPPPVAGDFDLPEIPIWLLKRSLSLMCSTHFLMDSEGFMLDRNDLERRKIALEDGIFPSLGNAGLFARRQHQRYRTSKLASQLEEARE